MSELMYKYQHAEHKQRNKDRNNNRNSITSDAEHQNTFVRRLKSVQKKQLKSNRFSALPKIHFEKTKITSCNDGKPIERSHAACIPIGSADKAQGSVGGSENQSDSLRSTARRAS